MENKKDAKKETSNSVEVQNNVELDRLPEKSEAEYSKLVRRNQHVSNSDNEFLEPWCAGHFKIGCVDEVNGAGAAEVPGFTPTRHELRQLAKYWAETALEIEYDWFIYAQVGGTDMRLEPFAQRRIARIANLLGTEEVQKLVSEVEIEFGKKQYPRAWEIFCHGTKEEREQFQDEIHRALL